MVSSAAVIGVILVTNTLQSGCLLKDPNFNVSRSKNSNLNCHHIAINRTNLLKWFPSKSYFTQQYLHSNAPSLKVVKGKTYRGYLIPVGICCSISYFLTNFLFGPGLWYGKQLDVESASDIASSRVIGRNLFLKGKVIQPSKYFFISIEPSFLDRQPSLRLNYSTFNRFHPIAWGMVDELRMLDDDGAVLIGCGGLALSGGVRNFAPFLLVRQN